MKIMANENDTNNILQTFRWLVLWSSVHCKLNCSDHATGSYSLAVIFILRLFSTSAFRVSKFTKLPKGVKFVESKCMQAYVLNKTQKIDQEKTQLNLKNVFSNFWTTQFTVKHSNISLLESIFLLQNIKNLCKRKFQNQILKKFVFFMKIWLEFIWKNPSCLQQIYFSRCGDFGYFIEVDV